MNENKVVHDYYSGDELFRVLVAQGARTYKVAEWLHNNPDARVRDDEICNLVISLTRGCMDAVIDPATGKPKKFYENMSVRRKF